MGETITINSGNRYNAGKKDSRGLIKEAVYVAVVGARFEKPGKMEYQDIIDTLKYDFDRDPIFEEYYKQKVFSEKFDTVDNHGHFLLERYKQRMRLSFETFFLEADRRGKEQ